MAEMKQLIYFGYKIYFAHFACVKSDVRTFYDRMELEEYFFATFYFNTFKMASEFKSAT